MTTEVYLSAREVARHLGVRTATLAKWRYLGKGPKGWIKLSETHVAYPAAELEAWKAERAATPAHHGFKRDRLASHARGVASDLPFTLPR